MTPVGGRLARGMCWWFAFRCELQEARANAGSTTWSRVVRLVSARGRPPLVQPAKGGLGAALVAVTRLLGEALRAGLPPHALQAPLLACRLAQPTRGYGI